MVNKSANVMNAELNQVRRLLLDEEHHNSDKDLMAKLGIAKTTFYRYKARIMEEGQKLSGVIHCRNGFDGNAIRLKGEIIFNISTELNLAKKNIATLKKVLFD